MSFIIFSNAVQIFHSFCLFNIIILRIAVVISVYIGPFKSFLCHNAHFTLVNIFPVGAFYIRG